MNKKIGIAIIVVLVLSIILNGIMGYLIAQKNNLITKFTNEFYQATLELETKKIMLSQVQDKLTSTETQLSQRQSDLAKEKEITSSLNQQVTDLINEKNSLTGKLDGFMCRFTMPSEQAALVATNESLVDPIAKMIEQAISGGVIYKGYTLLWNNSKDAYFVYFDKDQTSTKVVSVWDFDTGKLNAVYNINGNCFYYTINK